MQTLRCVLFALLVHLVLPQITPAAERSVGPWNIDELRQTPPASFAEPEGLLQAVIYRGEPFQNRATSVFAWYARPQGPGPFPGMVLVHGGGGTAFREWAEHWARRGYAAIAMDLAGNGRAGRLADGGPDQSDDTKFREFTSETVRDMWSYHAVAAILRAHSLLAAQPDVDRNRIGVTGISWGGYLTCIVAGIDSRVKVAVPVYGCGYLADNSVWREPRFDKMSPELKRLWVETFDPSAYLAGTTCPILFLNGTNDFAYPLDSYRKSYRLVKSDQTLAVIPRLPHGHIWTFPEVDAFVDSVLKKSPPLATLTEFETRGELVVAKATVPGSIRSAALHYTTDVGPWQQREWKSIPAEVREGVVSARLPAGGGLVYYLGVIDDRGLTVTTEHAERN